MNNFTSKLQPGCQRDNARACKCLILSKVQYARTHTHTHHLLSLCSSQSWPLALSKLSQMHKCYLPSSLLLKTQIRGHTPSLVHILHTLISLLWIIPGVSGGLWRFSDWKGWNFHLHYHPLKCKRSVFLAQNSLRPFLSLGFQFLYTLQPG